MPIFQFKAAVLKKLFPIKCILVLALLMPLVYSCKPSKEAIVEYNYFEKNIDSVNSIVLSLKEPVIQEHDIMSIVVSSATLDQKQAEIFNLLGTGGVQGGGGGGGGGAASAQGYIVDYDGTVSMPIIGKIKAAGLTKNQLADTLISKLDPYVKSPVINIRFVNFRVLLMGETSSKGWVTFPNEKATIVDAIGQSGGLGEQGQRTNILLIRQQPGGQLETHTIDMNDAMVFKSPYFQLQQNDIIYVLPNESKLIQYQRSNSPFFRDLPVYMALITSILAFATLIVSLTN